MTLTDTEMLLLLAKEIVWKNSINDHDTLHNMNFAQVAWFATVEMELEYTEEYPIIADRRLDLREFLESHSQSLTANQSRFASWSYMFMSVQDYCFDKRYGYELPYIEDEECIRSEDELLMIIYPPRLKGTLGNYKRESSEGKLLTSLCDNFTQPVATPAVGPLTQEILDLYKSKKVSANVVSKRQSIADRIANMLRNLYGSNEIRVEMFGSCANGLDTVDSDLDLCIIIPQHWIERDTDYGRKPIPEYFGTYYNMKFLSRKLGELGMIERRAIPKALVPICKFKDPRSGISCDINTANDMGVENSKLIQAYTKIDDRVRPFLYAIKHFSKQRRINDAFLGYLSSYSYVMMGLFYLMTCDPPVLPNLQALGRCSVHHCRANHIKKKLTIYKGKIEEFDVSFHTCVQGIVSGGRNIEYGPTATYWKQRNTSSVCELLLGFFRYYILDHDYDGMISIYGGLNCSRPNQWKNNALVIQDPFIKSRNVSGSCRTDAFAEIEKEFIRAFCCLNSGATFAHVCQFREKNHDPFPGEPIRFYRRGGRNLPLMMKAAEDVKNGDRQDYLKPCYKDDIHSEPEGRVPRTAPTTITTAPLSNSRNRVVHTLESVFGSTTSSPRTNTTRVSDSNEYIVIFVDMIPGMLDKKDFKDALCQYGRVVDIQTVKRSPETTIHEDWHMRILLDDPICNPLPDTLDVYDDIRTTKCPASSAEDPHSLRFTSVSRYP